MSGGGAHVDGPRAPVRGSLELLRAEANDERSVLIHERLRAGEDPWDFFDDLPTVDELVVLTLRAEALEAAGISHPDQNQSHRTMHRIALDHPALMPTVWKLLGGSESYRRWERLLRVVAN